MLLSARMLNGVADVNHFEVVQTLEFTQGDTPSVYFQLVDASADKRHDPPGRRYMPATGAAVVVVLKTNESTTTITKTAVQPFANDPSIWKFDLLSTDPVLVGTLALKLSLLEGVKVTTGFLGQAINIARNCPEF